MMDIYGIFIINCSYFNKMATMNFFSPLYCDGSACARACVSCLAVSLITNCSFGVVVDLQNNWLCFKFCLNAFSCTECIASSRLYIWLLNLFFRWAQMFWPCWRSFISQLFYPWYSLNGREGGVEPAPLLMLGREKSCTRNRTTNSLVVRS